MSAPVYIFAYRPPFGFTYPVITAQQAAARGISAGSLEATARWNERRGGARRKRQAAELRRVAAQLSAGNDNVARREAA